MERLSRRAALALVASSLTLGLGASAALAQVEIIERVMPTPQVEVIPAAPGANYHWVPGHYVWSRARVAWVWWPGRYVLGAVPPMPAEIVEVQPARPGQAWFWVRGHYVWENGRGWVWQRGRWMR